MKKKKVIFKGAKGERIEVILNEDDATKHHNKTINVSSGAWNKRNFSNDPTKVYDGLEIKQDIGEPLFSSWDWLTDLFKRKK